MRLDFNILWVEDQPSRIAAQIRALDREMGVEGFQLVATTCTEVDEVKEHLAEDLFRDEIDLILVDWDLGKGVQGQQVIKEIREVVPYKDVVFYSAVTDVSELRTAAFEEGLEGIYFVVRGELVDEVTQLFRSMIKKVLDLDHTRGIVMGATSDVDQTVRECLLAAHNLLNEEGQARVLSEMVNLIDDKVPNLTKQVKKLRTSTVDQIMGKHQTFTANDGLRILKRILETDQFKDLVHHVDGLTRYIQDVVPKRNILGHRVLSPEGKPQGIAGVEGETITLDELRELRRMLLELRQQFRDLHGSLQSGF